MSAALTKTPWRFKGTEGSEGKQVTPSMHTEVGETPSARMKPRNLHFAAGISW